MNKLFIVIVSFNGGMDLIKLIKRLLRERSRLKDTKIQVVVVDNATTDKSLQELRIMNKELKIKMIDKNKNLGFATGCNIGIKYALENRADATLLLNQDVAIPEGFIKQLITNSADIVSPVIKFERNGRRIYDYGGKVDWVWGSTKHWELVNRPIVQSSNYPIDYVSGCCMLIKKQVFERIGLLDCKYFLYFEDVDFCLRARKAGFKTAIELGITIVHHLKEGKDKPLIRYIQLVKSNFFFIHKWLPFYRKPLAYGRLGLLFAKILLNRFSLW